MMREFLLFRLKFLIILSVFLTKLSITTAQLNRKEDSCSEFCGESAENLTCRCDDGCWKAGECCSDYIPLCASTDSCKRRCGEAFDYTLPCSCTSDCIQYGNCCDDFIAECTTKRSCKWRCGEEFNSQDQCHCHSDCTENCCEDYIGVCVFDHRTYYCLDECGVDREFCSCKPECIEAKNCCSDYQLVCENKVSWIKEDCSTSQQCPDGYEEPILILFSIDGFRAEYINRQETPYIWKTASCGVHAPYMRSAYPTVTFPNHYTIVTGLYPESHGIIDNTMYDHKMKEEFKLGSETSFKSFWWGGEPFWITTKQQGKKSACYFWPGSDVNMTHGYPDYWELYDGSVPFEQRMYGALDWIDLPKDERPSFITLYIENVDHAGHSDGPDSDEVNKQLKIADRAVSYLIEGLRLRGLENCVNIIILADHGMSPISCERKSNVESYGINMDDVYFRGGASGRVGKSIDVDKQDLYDADEVNSKLKCTRNESHWQSFIKYEYFPKRFHYAKNDRIEDVLLTMDDQWIVEGKKDSYTSCNGGNHGFDNEFKSMHALFTGHGPAFKNSFSFTDPFEAIEVYNLMSDILDVTPAPNNGTQGSLNHLLKNPKKRSFEKNLMSEDTCLFDESSPTEVDCKSCQSINANEFNKRLDLTTSTIDKYQSKHLLFGKPQVLASQNDPWNYCLLTNEDYVIAYDKTKKNPFYVSYMLTSQSLELKSSKLCPRFDPRVDETFMTSCTTYEDSSLIEWMYLFPSELSNDENEPDTSLTTNIVPIYLSFKPVWKYMTAKLDEWSRAYGSIHVISGPIYDYNFDGIADTLDIINSLGEGGSIKIPTHYFIIISRCKYHEENRNIGDCIKSIEDIETLSYIIPNYSYKQCNQVDDESLDWVEDTVIQHLCRIRDIELLTNMIFMEKYSEEMTSNKWIGLRLKLPQFDSDWFKIVNSHNSIHLNNSSLLVIVYIFFSYYICFY